MCFHSPYAEFWHLYTFPKLLSISKEINFCLDLCCKSELVLGCCGEMPKATQFSPSKGTSVGGWRDRSGLCRVPQDRNLDHQQTERRKWLLLRETNPFPGRQAVALVFLPSACFSAREREATCLLKQHPLPWQEGRPHTGAQFLPSVYQPPSPIPLTYDSESHPALGT